MSWLVITAIIFSIVTLVCAAVKLLLMQKVEDIDGLCGIHTGQSNVIASIGNGKPRTKSR